MQGTLLTDTPKQLDKCVDRDRLSTIHSRKSEAFSEWYNEVITKGELIELYDISGCYIMRPNGFAMWEHVRDFIDKEIKKLGVASAYFPLFVTKNALETGKNHVEELSPEVTWVTKSGSSDLAEPIAVRSTSETIMYPAYAKWIRSHRDLPLRLNQWANAVRWESQSTIPFIKSREFLWQEGHSAFATRGEAEIEIHQILDIYTRAYEELLAVPVLKGTKTDVEKFAGSLYTKSLEAFIPSNGLAVQAAVSQCLGQNFSKMFDIQFSTGETSVSSREYVWQNSWGFTTRSLGITAMVHGDDKGLVIPPKVAPIQVVFLPTYFDDSNIERMNTEINQLCSVLKNAGVRVHIDTRKRESSQEKGVEWEVKGVPLAIIYGPNNVELDHIVCTKRNDGKNITVKLDEHFASNIQRELELVQKELFVKAKRERDYCVKEVTEWEDFVPTLDQKNLCLISWCGTNECEENIKNKSREETEVGTTTAKSICVLLEQMYMLEDKKCLCGKEGKKWTVFGRSY